MSCKTARHFYETYLPFLLTISLPQRPALSNLLATNLVFKLYVS